jgi:hypothetical protein
MTGDSWVSEILIKAKAKVALFRNLHLVVHSSTRTKKCMVHGWQILSKSLSKHSTYQIRTLFNMSVKIPTHLVEIKLVRLNYPPPP